MDNSFERFVIDTLIGTLTPTMKDSVARLLAAGQPKEKIMAVVTSKSSKNSMVAHAVEAWIDRLVEEKRQQATGK